MARHLHRLDQATLFRRTRRSGGKARWNTFGTGSGVAGLTFELVRAMHDVALGADPPVQLTRRASGRLAEIRLRFGSLVHPTGSVVNRNRSELRWWTWAGFRANATLATTLSDVTDPAGYFDDSHIRLRSDLTIDEWRAATTDAAQRLCLPDIDDRALAGLKFSTALPHRLAVATLAARLADLPHAITVLSETTVFNISDTD